ncbi:MAG TPA: hypothetical protein IGR64_17575 [Leptolyngbyaceae cyanobacterium M65_K2018_010]|nr:hypothetical protein [Leptolyngbyaceae cyanobacterium M65_K2018_010]
MPETHTLIKAIERLDHRVTIGDVAAEAGLSLQEAQQGVLALASEVQAHLQVSEAGEIAYVFPRNMQAILLSKSWRLRWRAVWQHIWKVLFYLIRISFGVVLILSLVLITLAIVALVIAASAASQRDDSGRDGGFGGGMVVLPRVWFGPDIFWLFDFDDRRRRPRPKGDRTSPMNFLEAVFSFLFGDGNPNADLEERRWQAIAAVVKANGGVVVAEQIIPFLNDLGQGWAKDFEDFMLPVLSRFNGLPQVSPAGGLVYQFPELQVTAQARGRIAVPRFLQELPRKFSQASSGQIMGAIGLGSANLIGALVLGNLLQDQALVAQIGGVVALANSLYWVLLSYGSAFLGIPLVRYFWVQRQNQKIMTRNQEREQRAEALAQLDDPLREKLAFAKTLVTQTIVTSDDLAYTTETDLVEQEAANKDRLDEEWQRLLEQRRSS